MQNETGILTVEQFEEFFGERPNLDNRSINWKAYCVRELDQPTCDDCCYVNYGRDCRNKPVAQIGKSVRLA